MMFSAIGECYRLKAFSFTMSDVADWLTGVIHEIVSHYGTKWKDLERPLKFCPKGV